MSEARQGRAQQILQAAVSSQQEAVASQRRNTQHTHLQSCHQHHTPGEHPLQTLAFTQQNDCLWRGCPSNPDVNSQKKEMEEKQQYLLRVSHGKLAYCNEVSEIKQETKWGFSRLSTVMPCTLQMKTGSLRAKEPCKSSKRPGYLGIYPCEGYMCTCVYVHVQIRVKPGSSVTALYVFLKLSLSVTCNLRRKQGLPTTEFLSPWNLSGCLPNIEIQAPPCLVSVLFIGFHSTALADL